MIISNERKFAFFHVPKTGGSTLCHTLAPRSDNLKKFPEIAANHHEILADVHSSESTVREVFNSLKSETQGHGARRRSEFTWMHLFHEQFLVHSGPASPKNLVALSQCSGCFKFCFCRNPWDYALSVFKNKIVVDSFAKQFVNGMDWRQEVEKRISKESFSQFIREIDQFPTIHNDFFTPHRFQSRFVISRTGERLVDHVARFENYQQELKFLAGKIGFRIDNVRDLNVSTVKQQDLHKYREFYDDYSRDFIAKTFRRDIEFFGYDY